MSSKIKITALALAILAFFLFVGSPFNQAASAVVGVDDAIIAIIIAALAAIGITFVTTGAYNNLNDYVESLFNEYASYNNTSVEALLRGTQAASDKFGRILINNRFVVLISSFGAWLKSKFDLADNGIYNVVATGYDLGNLVVYGNTIQIPAGASYYDEYIFQTGSVSLVVDTNNATSSFLCLISESHSTISYSVTRYYKPTGAQVWNRTNTANLHKDGDYQGYTINSDLYWVALSTVSTNDIINYAPTMVINTKQDFADALNSSDSLDYNNIGIDIKTGDIALPLDDDNYTDGDGAIIDVGADWGTTIGGITDDVIPGDFSDGKEGEASISYEGDQEIENQVEDTLQQTISNNVNDYQSPGLQSVFPFCIPFDIYAFFECLAAEPVAPSFTWRFYVPGICDEEFTVDLAPFNTVAQVVRTMELLAFIVGLALVTRDKFLRG